MLLCSYSPHPLLLLLRRHLSHSHLSHSHLSLSHLSHSHVVAGRRVRGWSPQVRTRAAIGICTQGISPVRVEDGAAIVICTQGVRRARWRGAAIVICAQGVAPMRVRDSAAVVICTQVRCSRAFEGFTGNMWTVRALGISFSFGMALPL